MPKRVPPEVDRKILVDLGLGKSNKEVAETYEVSASYVSKVKTGKKSLFIMKPPLPNGIELDTIQYLETRIIVLRRELGIHEELLKIYKGEKLDG